MAGKIQPTTQQAIAAQLRAVLARQDISARELARRMGVAHTWVTDRRKGSVTVSVEDVIRMAPHLGMDATELFGALYPDTPQRGMLSQAHTDTYGERKDAQILTFRPRHADQRVSDVQAC